MMEWELISRERVAPPEWAEAFWALLIIENAKELHKANCEEIPNTNKCETVP